MIAVRVAQEDDVDRAEPLYRTVLEIEDSNHHRTRRPYPITDALFGASDIHHLWLGELEQDRKIR